MDYLNEHGDEYNQVLVADTRDVIFQGDVFKEFESCEDFLGYTLEVHAIGDVKADSACNYNWLVNCFGKIETDKLIDKIVICCGTVVGSVNEMKDFLTAMLKYLPTLPQSVNDQATANYVIYNNLLPVKNLIPIDCQTGAIFTAGIYNKIYPIKTEDKFILRGDGGVPAVVHQYDRSPSLIQLVDEVYRAKDFQPNNRFTDAKSATEQLYHLVRIGNFDGALRFFADNSLHRKNFAGYGDTLLDILLMMLNVNQTAEVEIFETAIQRAVINAFNKEISLPQMNKIYAYINTASKTNRPISPSLKNFVVVCSFETAKFFMQNGNAPQAAAFMDAVMSLDIPMNTDFYLFQADVYRRVNRNEESLSAYRKALNLK